LPIRVLPDSLINQIAAGEVVERPASVVKELVENSLDSGADQIVIDVADGGRTLVSVIDNGKGMDREDLASCIKRHATSKLPGDDLLDIGFMGFRGEALPSIASVSDMFIETRDKGQETKSGSRLDCTTGEIRPSAWEEGTRVRVENLFAKTPARLKFLRGDRAEMMSVTEVVKRLAMARPDAGFTLNNKWRFPKKQPLIDRIASVMGDDVAGRMIAIDAPASDGRERIGLRLRGYISEPTLRRASPVDQYLFVNGRPVKDKVLVGALRAAYMDVMHAREFPLCALYLELPPREVDVNVSPAKTEVHFLEPARVRGFIIKTLRDALAAPLMRQKSANGNHEHGPRDQWRGPDNSSGYSSEYEILHKNLFRSAGPLFQVPDSCSPISGSCSPLGRVVGQIGSKYILAENERGLVIVDQHAAHERITYERLRARAVKGQPLLLPIIANLKPEEASAVMEIADELKSCGLAVDSFGDDAVVINEKPADWDLDWNACLRDIAAEVLANGHSSGLQERLHLKLANHACHHSVRAGQRLSFESMDALLREIELTERGGECNHGRPAWRQVSSEELDGWFERS
jgi:DNA mismatch repair protein MutL